MYFCVLMVTKVPSSFKFNSLALIQIETRIYLVPYKYIISYFEEYLWSYKFLCRESYTDTYIFVIVRIAILRVPQNPFIFMKRCLQKL